IAEKSESHDKKLEEIRNTTTATERRIADIVSRIAEMEDHLCFLEDAREKQEANPMASSAEVEILRQKLDDMENRERRNNLRFLGFTESCEGSDLVAFLKPTLPTLLNINFPKGLEIDRAHRLGQLSPGQGNQPSRPRPIIVRFERFQDREHIAKAARKRERRIMVFPDYSKLLSDKRRKFDKCKKLLHEKRVHFFLNYPAVLTVITSRGRERFEDHKKSMAYIRSME
uniref:L1 transposable element RRM domain-containing protein n=1 Tax=Poecilia formosa TaxID=48698 RepID=A0A087X3W3_POEFO